MMKSFIFVTFLRDNVWKLWQISSNQSPCLAEKNWNQISKLVFVLTELSVAWFFHSAR